MSMSIGGLSSGLDTTSIISQLMQLEAQPQNLLKARLTDARSDASAYRAVNSVFTTLKSAAEALTKATAWSPAKASSTSATVSASAAAGATEGSISFTVDQLAATHTVITQTAWTPPVSDMTLTVADADGDTPAKSVTIAANATVQSAVDMINATTGIGVTASVVNTGNGSRLQLTADASGLDGTFTVTGGPVFDTVSAGADAKLTVGGGVYTATSATNTFADLMAGTTFTVSQQGAAATITVASDPAAVTAAVQAMVTAANSALSTIREYANNGPGSTAVLRGDSSLRALAGQIAEAVSYAVGADLPPVGDGSPARTGIQLNRDGTIKFDAAAFSATLEADPALAQRLVNGSGAGTSAVPGVAQRLLEVARRASDATTGTLITLANGKDTEAGDIQQRIDDWDQRLELRRATLTRQFTAMESALSGLQNQSSWLSSQLANLPGWSTSSSK